MSDPSRFEPGSVGAFRVTDRMFDTESRSISLGYAFDDDQSFVETITFETPPPETIGAVTPGLARALLHLHVAAGTSYYKAAAPPVVMIEGESLGAGELRFHQNLYDQGLREFAVTNGLAVPLRLEVKPRGGLGHPDPPTRFARTGGLLVPIGGGKDSLVLIEAVRHLEPRLFAVNPHPLVVELAAQIGLPLLVVRRSLSPRLVALNRAGALNGHVPITAIISLIAVVGSFLYGYDTIAMAVERSASEESATVDGVSVNHQYSKSLEFEHHLADLISSTIDPDLRYGSALRPYSELAIARAFARLTGYHATFCSCNTVFRQTAAADDGWCGNCPKCRFVGLILAPFVEPAELTAIFGRDMFTDPGQVPGFAALISTDDKPFECVGERRESAAAIRILSDLPQWKDTAVVTALRDRARGMVSAAEVGDLLNAQEDLAFPDRDVSAGVDSLLTEGA
jgi:UDP-N-acetyl-alpha-D-muramoyl-L-alanyl-L-glutamate epimerase